MKRRRGDGEGHVRLRADGRWEARLSLGRDESGRRKVKCIYGATQAEVIEELDALKTKVHANLPVTSDGVSVAVFIERWLIETVASRAEPRSVDAFSRVARVHIIPVIGRIRLDKLTPQHIASLLHARKSLSPQSRLNILTVLKSALDQAVRWNRVARNVAMLVDAPRVPRSGRRHNLGSFEFKGSDSCKR